MPSQISEDCALQSGQFHLQGKPPILFSLKISSTVFYRFCILEENSGSDRVLLQERNWHHLWSISEALSYGEIMPIVYISASVHTSFL